MDRFQSIHGDDTWSKPYCEALRSDEEFHSDDSESEEEIVLVPMPDRHSNGPHMMRDALVHIGFGLIVTLLWSIENCGKFFEGGQVEGGEGLARQRARHNRLRERGLEGFIGLRPRNGRWWLYGYGANTVDAAAMLAIVCDEALNLEEVNTVNFGYCRLSGSALSPLFARLRRPDARGVRSLSLNGNLGCLSDLTVGRLVEQGGLPRSLTRLDVYGCGLSEDGILALKMGRPNLTIHTSPWSKPRI